MSVKIYLRNFLKKVTTLTPPPPATLTLLYCVGALFLLYLWFIYVTYPPILHPEVIDAITKETQRIDDSLAIDIARKIFDVRLTTENVYYRPRTVSFLLSYIDTNMMFFLNRYISMGARFILYPVGFLILFAGIYYLLRHLFPETFWTLAFVIAASSLFSQQMLSTLGVLLRSAKIFAPGICVWIFLYFEKSYKIKYNKYSLIKYVGVATVFFLSMLIDEQIIATVLFFCFISLAISVFQKRTNVVFPVLCTSLTLYALYYKYIGRMLMSKFSDGALIMSHPHQFTDIFRINKEVLLKAFEVWSDAIASFFFSSFVVFVLIISIYSFMLYYKKIIECFIFSSVVLFSYALVPVLVASHSAIYILRDLRYGMYLAPSLFLLLSAIFYGISHVDILSNKKILAILAIFFIFMGAYHASNANDYFYTHASFRGGHLQTHDIEQITLQDIPDELRPFVDLLEKHNIRDNYLLSF